MIWSQRLKARYHEDRSFSRNEITFCDLSWALTNSGSSVDCQLLENESGNQRPNQQELVAFCFTWATNLQVALGTVRLCKFLLSPVFTLFERKIHSTAKKPTVLIQFLWILKIHSSRCSELVPFFSIRSNSKRSAMMYKVIVGTVVTTVQGGSKDVSE